MRNTRDAAEAEGGTSSSFEVDGGEAGRLRKERRYLIKVNKKRCKLKPRTDKHLATMAAMGRSGKDREGIKRGGQPRCHCRSEGGDPFLLSVSYHGWVLGGQSGVR